MMKKLSPFFQKNRQRLFQMAINNTEYNEHGQAILTNDDPWSHDDVWDKDYKELENAERRYTAAIDKARTSVVC